MITTVYNEVSEDLLFKLKEHNCAHFLQNFNLLKVLHNTNKCKQRYHLLECKGEYAFFCEYKLKLNIFTYSNFSLKYPVKIIGIPCSVSLPGFATSSPRMEAKMFAYLGAFKGAVIVLNSYDIGEYMRFVKGETLPTHLIDVRWNSINDYLEDMRSGYRYRLKKAMRNLEHIVVQKISNTTFTDEHYSLYLNVFNKSEFKLEKLSKEFFIQFGDITEFVDNSTPRGFIQTYYSREGKKLYFMFCGLDYSYNKVADLYYLMLYEIVRQGIKLGCKLIDLGQTTTDTKVKFAARLQRRYMYVTHSNRIIRGIVKKNIALLSYNEIHTEHNVMKSEGDINEDITYKT